MAISPDIKGIEVTVLVSGQTATEYQGDSMDKEPIEGGFDPRPGGVHVIKYIEAKPGQPFGVHVARTSDFVKESHHMACEIVIDDDVCVLLPDAECGGAPKDTWSRTCSWHSVRKSEKQEVIQDWKFATLNVDTSDIQVPSAEEMQKHIEQLKGFGTIKVYLYHMKATTQTVEAECSFVREEYNNIPEKALKGKALGLTMSYDNTSQDIVCSFDEVLRFDDPHERPFAAFEFRYRTKENLYQEGILERPIGVEDKREVARGIKREAERPDDLEERPQRTYKERRLRGGRFEVDLTLSDSE